MSAEPTTPAGRALNGMGGYHLPPPDDLFGHFGECPMYRRGEECDCTARIVAIEAEARDADTPATHDLPSSIFGKRHTENCESCARPTTAYGRRLLAQFHGWPDRKEYPWNLLGPEDILAIEREASASATTALLRAALAAAPSEPRDAFGNIVLDCGCVSDGNQVILLCTPHAEAAR